MSETISPKMWKEIKKDIKKVVNIYWNDEERHYEENDKPRGHVFNSLKRLKEVVG